MTFKDIKQNYPVYILDKQELTVTTGKATAVSFPRIDNNVGNTIQPQMVIDITIDAGGKSAVYTIPENLSVTYAGNRVFSTDRDGLIREIEAMKNAAEQVLASVDHQKAIVEKSASLLAELNPIYKEKAQTEARFKELEGAVSDIKDMFSELMKQMKK